MQSSYSDLNPGSEHKHRSKCYSCVNYEFGIGFCDKNTCKPFAEHLCIISDPSCIPGDCVINCHRYEYVPGKLVDRFNDVA